MQLKEAERRNTRLHSAENLLWNRLWTCHKTDHMMMVTVLYLPSHLVSSDWIAPHQTSVLLVCLNRPLCRAPVKLVALMYVTLRGALHCPSGT